MKCLFCCHNADLKLFYQMINRSETMKQILLTPLYCPNCGHLTFVHPQGLLDANNHGFVEHPCRLHKKKNIMQSEALKDQRRITEGMKDYFFKPRPTPSQPKKKDLKTALVLGFEENGDIRVIGTDGYLYRLKPFFEGEVVPGEMLKLGELQRIGQGRYRIHKKETLLPPQDFSELIKLPEEFYQIQLHSDDINLLEKIQGELVQICLNEGINPYSVTSLPRQETEGRILMGRQIELDPTANLLARINEALFPDSVRISIKQVHRS